VSHEQPFHDRVELAYPPLEGSHLVA
jgi:hypothetical protein